MTIFAIRIDKNQLSEQFFTDTTRRLNTKDIVRNPFDGNIIKLKGDLLTDTYLIKIEPIYPRFYMMGILSLGVAVLFTQRWWAWWYIPSLFLLATIVLWSKFFYIFMLNLGLKKIGYNGKIEIVRKDEILEGMIKSVL